MELVNCHVPPVCGRVKSEPHQESLKEQCSYPGCRGWHPSSCCSTLTQDVWRASPRRLGQLQCVKISTWSWSTSMRQRLGGKVLQHSTSQEVKTEAAGSSQQCTTEAASLASLVQRLSTCDAPTQGGQLRQRSSTTALGSTCIDCSQQVGSWRPSSGSSGAASASTSQSALAQICRVRHQSTVKLRVWQLGTWSESVGRCCTCRRSHSSRGQVDASWQSVSVRLGPEPGASSAIGLVRQQLKLVHGDGCLHCSCTWQLSHEPSIVCVE
ncbi:hypothetical protein COO60DRAFT_1182333 [Scenedesmus sp. NREL 46B-D3]|nr:hypothetical protein COO60DRAFT_1182333 [Scenedesmus sp. NREL 46B-D3]